MRQLWTEGRGSRTLSAGGNQAAFRGFSSVDAPHLSTSNWRLYLMMKVRLIGPRPSSACVVLYTMNKPEPAPEALNKAKRKGSRG